jgi:glucose-6-phosphate 1-dehydrogenase
MNDGPAAPTGTATISTRASVQIQMPTVSGGRDRADPCTMVICGALGDLSRRKLLPAIYHLMREQLVHDQFAVLGVGRDDTMTDDTFRTHMRKALGESDEIKGVDDDLWGQLCPRLFFVSADLTNPDEYDKIGKRLAEIELSRKAEDRNRIFYLAVPPSVFEPIVRSVSKSGLAPRTRTAEDRPWYRIVVEKPFGRSLETAQQLNDLLLGLYAEHQTYRIDHYLGKETVQNILVLRFANSIFEPLWNRQWVQHVQITASEEVGVEDRGKYYEEAGVLRDMFQNHLLQLLTLTAMEPPPQMSANAVRDEKVKVLRSIRWLTPESIPNNAVRAQYTAGTAKGMSVRGYTEEPNVAADSAVPTFAAVRLFVDNWRWNGVPFYLRSGTRLKKRVSEIAVTFRAPPHLMFGHHGNAMRPNTLVMRVQPNEGVSLNFEVKVPGAAVALTSNIEIAAVDMEFDYSEAFGEISAPAYETLLLDIMIGEATLFTRSDEVEAAWRVIDPLIKYWETNKPKRMPTYASGSWGPREADEMIEKDGMEWRELR